MLAPSLKHWICDVTRLFDAIVYFPEGPTAYYADLAIPVNVVKTGLYIFECMVGDSLMVLPPLLQSRSAYSPKKLRSTAYG